MASEPFRTNHFEYPAKNSSHATNRTNWAGVKNEQTERVSLHGASEGVKGKVSSSAYGVGVSTGR